MAENSTEWLPDKASFKDEKGALRTQGLFLEVNYEPELAIYTFGDEDKMYDGKLFKSLKLLYLDMEDPTEYSFANKYFYNWRHWQRIVANKMLLEKIEPWREELEIRLRSKAVRKTLDMVDTNFNAAKWAMQGLWKLDGSRRGRPSAEERRQQRAVERKVAEETGEDLARVQKVVALRSGKPNG